MTAPTMPADSRDMVLVPREDDFDPDWPETVQVAWLARDRLRQAGADKSEDPDLITAFCHVETLFQDLLALSASPARGEGLREKVAEIIDPWAFNQCEWASRDDNDEVLREFIPKRDAALAKADAILAALQPQAAESTS